MMKYVITIPLVLLVTLVQTGAAPSFHFMGARPDLVVVFLACWAMIRSQEELLVLLSVAGASLGLIGAEPFGVALIALAPIGLLTGLKDTRIMEGEFLPALLVVFAASLAYNTLFLVTLQLTGQEAHWLRSIFWIFLPGALLNVLVASLLYWPIRWVGGALGGERVQAPEVAPWWLLRRGRSSR